MQYIPIQKIEALEKEIEALKNKPKKKASHKKESLAGFLKGIKFSEKDIREAKRSLFPYSSR